MVVTSIKVPLSMLKELRKAAWRASLRAGEAVSWGSLVRKAIEQYLLADTEVKEGPGQQAAAAS